MSYNIAAPILDPNSRALIEQNSPATMRLNAYNVTRIVYEVIRLYMANNTAESVNIPLNQKYNIDSTKSDILLDVGYNWRTKDMSKVPAIYVARGDLTFQYPTLGHSISYNDKTGGDTRTALSKMPIIISCIAAEPVAVVENLAEYVKQPLLYFRKEVQNDFGIRSLVLEQITKPKLLSEGKNNFIIEVVLEVTFNDTWVITRDSLILKRIGVDIYDNLAENFQSLSV